MDFTLGSYLISQTNFAEDPPLDHGIVKLEVFSNKEVARKFARKQRRERGGCWYIELFEADDAY